MFDYDKLYNDVYSVWLLKCISGNIGFNQECYKHTFDFTKISDFAPTKMYPNDDLDIQIAWLDLLLEKGFSYSSSDLLEKFIDCYHFDFSEYGYAKRNYKRGITPPYSGKYNNYFSNCMGCPIRAEIWGIIAAGNPTLASALAEKDGIIDHSGDSVEAEKLIACMISLGFVIKDLDALFTEALKYIDANSLVYKVVNFVREKHKNGVTWKQIIDKLYKLYASPDGTNIIINIGIFTLGLYSGGSDYDKVMTLTLNGGYDTDCTCASAGAVYALVYGLDNVEKKWIDIAGENIVTACKNIKNDLSTFSLLTYNSMKILCGISKAGISDVSIQNNPFSAIKQSDEKVNFSVNYTNGAELKDEKVEIEVAISNNTSDVLFGELELISPPHLSASTSEKTLTLNAKQSKTVTITVENADKEKSYDKNVLTLKYNGQSYDFGLAGSQAYRIIGVFFDGFDFDKIGDIGKLEEDRVRVWNNKKYLFHMDVNEYTNNWVRYNHEYIDENFAEKFDDYFDKGEKYFTNDDFIKLDELYSVHGPIVAYAFQKLLVDEECELEFHIGSTDPYKLWLNGEMIACQEDNWYFSPYNQRPRATLNKGENKIVIKMLRKGEAQKFAYVLREKPFNHVGAIATDMKFVK